MSQRPWMGWLIGTIHDLLKIIQELLCAETLRFREGIRKQPE